MKRIRILALILCACFVSAAWAQPHADGPRMGKFAIHHRAMNSFPTTDAVPSSSLVAVQVARQNKVWELGTFPGGTWASMGDVNDFGIAVAQGDVSDGSTTTSPFPCLAGMRESGLTSARWVERKAVGTRASSRSRTRA